LLEGDLIYVWDVFLNEQLMNIQDILSCVFCILLSYSTCDSSQKRYW